MRPYKARNKRIIMRLPSGRFRKATAADLGIGVCSTPNCNHLTIRVYDGGENDEFPDPRKFRYRCFTCEPKIEAELTAESAKAEAAKGQVSSFEKMLREAAATVEAATKSRQ